MARIFDRLSDQILADKTGLKRWGQKICEQLEAAIADIQAQVTDIQDALDAALQAQADAADAASDAAAAQTEAETVKRDDAISASTTSPGTILSAADVGSNATITIAAHTRKYGDGTSVSVNGGSISGRAFSTTYYVYYTQTSRAGGAVSYQSTTDPNTALTTAAAGRHYCGKVTTPADGGGSTSGGFTPPGGFTGPGEIP
jgi:hypothetical protein